MCSSKMKGGPGPAMQCILLTHVNVVRVSRLATADETRYCFDFPVLRCLLRLLRHCSSTVLVVVFTYLLTYLLT